MYLIGVDIGGTNLKIGLIKDDKIIDRQNESTNAENLINQIENQINILLINNNLKAKDISGMGVGCPGIINNGIVIESANLNLHGVNLQKILEDRLKIKVEVKNDADMATLSEHKLGAGKGCKNMIMLTLGTGVGGGIIVDNKLYSGNSGSGELGHITFQINGIPCNCGRKGCMEKYVSCSALDKQAKELMNSMPNNIPLDKNGNVRASDLIRLYDTDDCAKLIIDRYVEYLSDGVMNYCNIFRPDKIVIGGGISYAPKIIEMVAERCSQFDYGYKKSDKVDIVVAELGNDAGILGVTTLF